MSLSRTHAVEVEGVGRFVFRKRRMDSQVKIEALALRMTDGPLADDWISHVARVTATLRVLTEEAPEGWDVDGLDPLDQGDTDRMLKVYGGLRDAEEGFRRKD